jgi:hypothetical protein
MLKKIFLTFATFLIFCRPVLASGVEYNLPYPGLLPDSPLYVLKIARDNLFLGLIRDQRQNAFYKLFLADKRLAAGEQLVKAGKKDLGMITVLKSQEYYHQAVDAATKIKNSDLTAKLIVAGAKHEEVISRLEPKAPGNDTSELKTALLDTQKDENRVLELLKVQ